MTHRSRTCAKCGYWDTNTRHNTGAPGWVERPSWDHCHTPRWGSPREYHSRTDEHLDFCCRTCGFEWEGDCMDAKETAKP